MLRQWCNSYASCRKSWRIDESGALAVGGETYHALGRALIDLRRTSPTRSQTSTPCPHVPQRQTEKAITAMNTETVLVALAVALATLALAWMLWRKERERTDFELQQQISEIRKLEKTIHVREAEFLEEKNQMEIVKAEAIRIARSTGYDEGRAFGRAERERDHLMEITKLRSDFAEQLVKERESAANDARDRQRAEYELQTKLFTVKICPYLRITEDKSFFNKKHELVSGYQYQLLINGIPAFSPHVIPERTEIKSEINPQLEAALLAIAEKAADAAINLYLGSNIQFARLAPAIVERISK